MKLKNQVFDVLGQEVVIKLWLWECPTKYSPFVLAVLDDSIPNQITLAFSLKLLQNLYYTCIPPVTFNIDLGLIDPLLLLLMEELFEISNLFAFHNLYIIVYKVFMGILTWWVRQKERDREVDLPVYPLIKNSHNTNCYQSFIIMSHQMRVLPLTADT